MYIFIAISLGTISRLVVILIPINQLKIETFSCSIRHGKHSLSSTVLLFFSLMPDTEYFGGNFHIFKDGWTF